MNDIQSPTLAVDTLLGLISQGGPIVVILCLFSLIAVTLFVSKCWQFSKAGLLQTSIQQQAQYNEFFHHLLQGREDLALQHVNNVDRPIARLLNLALTMKQEHSGNEAGITLLREELVRIASLNLQTLRSKLRLMEMIASLSPLLGLLGTVIGMIAAFKAMQSAGPNVDPATLSGGIWEALLTTAAGLIVAIPTAAGLSWLERKVERFQQQVESEITRFFTVCLYQEKPITSELKTADIEKQTGNLNAPSS